MKQRTVINVPMNEEASRKKAMKLASEMKGVSKVEVVRDRNYLVVVGEEIDSVKLVNSLRKKFCFANIISLHNNRTTHVLFEEEDEHWPARSRYEYPSRSHYEYPSQPYQRPGYYVAYDPDPPTPCSIM